MAYSKMHSWLHFCLKVLMIVGIVSQKIFYGVTLLQKLADLEHLEPGTLLLGYGMLEDCHDALKGINMAGSARIQVPG